MCLVGAHKGLAEFAAVVWPDPAVNVSVISSVRRVLDAVVDDDSPPNLFAAMYDVMSQVRTRPLQFDSGSIMIAV